MISRSTGFTLLEVLVALAVAAIGLASVIKVAGSNAYNAQHLQNKTFAQWVAMNRIAELQLESALIPLEKKKGSEELMGRKWYWQQTVEDASRFIKEIQVQNLRKIIINVYADEEGDTGSLATVEMLMGPR